MAKDYPWDYDATAINNSDIGGVNIAEGCNFGNMNNAIRELMSHKAAELSEATLASASATDMATTATTCVNITGTTTISGFGTVKAGVYKLVRFAGALQLTHNATSFILPGGANITTVAGDTAVFKSEGSGNWRCHAYQRAAGLPPALLDEDDMASDSATDAPSQQSVKAFVESTTQGKKTIWIPASDMRSAITNGAQSTNLSLSTANVLLPVFAFDPSTQEHVHFPIWMPKSYAGGTVIFQAVWAHPTTMTDFGVVWNLEGRAIGDGVALDTAIAGGNSSADTGGSANYAYVSPESTVTIQNTPAGEKPVIFEMYRNVSNGSDTMAVDAYLIGVTITYTTDAATDD